MQVPYRILLQRVALGLRCGAQLGVDLARCLDDIGREFDANPLDEHVARGRILFAVRHVPRERSLELTELDASVFEEELELGDFGLERRVTGRAPRRAAQTEALGFVAAFPRFDVAQLQHVFDVHQRIDERCADDDFLVFAAYRADARLAAVSLVFVEPDHDLVEARAELYPHRLGPINRDAALRHVLQFALDALGADLDFDVHPDRAKIR